MLSALHWGYKVGPLASHTHPPGYKVKADVLAIDPAMVSVTAEPSESAPTNSNTVPTRQAWSMVKVLAPTVKQQAVSASCLSHESCLWIWISESLPPQGESQARGVEQER